MKSQRDDDQYCPEDTERRRDAVLKIMVNTLPQPHATHRPTQSGRRKSTGADRARKDACRQQKS
jgi:hypothetical protein